jgi:hypothetical protein
MTTGEKLPFGFLMFEGLSLALRTGVGNFHPPLCHSSFFAALRARKRRLG